MFKVDCSVVAVVGSTVLAVGRFIVVVGGSVAVVGMSVVIVSGSLVLVGVSLVIVGGSVVVVDGSDEVVSGSFVVVGGSVAGVSGTVVVVGWSAVDTLVVVTVSIIKKNENKIMNYICCIRRTRKSTNTKNDKKTECFENNFCNLFKKFPASL